MHILSIHHCIYLSIHEYKHINMHIHTYGAISTLVVVSQTLDSSEAAA
jgi:hypothetical protein